MPKERTLKDSDVNKQLLASSRRVKKLYQFFAVIIATAFISSAITLTISADGPSGFTTEIGPGSLVTGASYIVYEDSGEYFFKNGLTGATDFEGASFDSLWGNMMATMTSGGKVYVQDGTFTKTTVTGLDVLSNVQVIMSQGTVITVANNVGNDYRIFSQASRTNISITGGTIDGNKAGQTTTTGVAAMGIGWASVTNSLIQNVHIRNIGTAVALSGYGIYLNNAQYNRIVDNQIEGSKRENLVLFTNSDYCVVSGNLFKDAADRHVVVHSSSYALITDNIMRNSVGYAVNLFSETKHYGIEFSHNQIYDSTDNAIHCSAIDDLKIVDNEIYECGNYGIYVYNPGDFTDVSRNTVVNATIVGIRVLADHVMCQGNKIDSTETLGATDRGIRIEGEFASIVGNIVDNTTVGIHLAGSYGLVDSNVVTDCDVANANGIFINAGFNDIVSNNILYYNLKGIYVDTTSNGTSVLGNSVVSSDQDGIYIDGADSTFISGNYLYDNGVTAVGGAMNGIAIANAAAGVKITSNAAYKGTHQQYAIRAFSGTSGVVVEFNMLTNGGTTAAISDASTSAVIRYNAGYVTENSGSATITGSVSTVVVTHSLVTTPLMVVISGNNTGIGYFVITTIGATTFTITFENQPSTSTWAFYWYAQTW